MFLFPCPLQRAAGAARRRPRLSQRAAGRRGGALTVAAAAPSCRYTATFTPYQIAFLGEHMKITNIHDWMGVFILDRMVRSSPTAAALTRRPSPPPYRLALTHTVVNPA